MLTVDLGGNVVDPPAKDAQKTPDRFEPLNDDFRNRAARPGAAHQAGAHLDAQCRLKHAGGEWAPSAHYIAEADSHGLFEVRFHRLGHRDGGAGLDPAAGRRSLPGGSPAAQEAVLFFEKFASLSTYYNEVNKVCYNVCPAFYKFKIQPFQSLFDRKDRVPQNVGVDCASAASDLDRASDSRQGDPAQPGRGEQGGGESINRVYEVEEHMGGDFIEELAKMHHDHVKLQEHSLAARLGGALAGRAGLDVPAPEQKSLPAYVYGLKIAEMCKQLEQVTCYGRGQLRGAGRIIYDAEQQCLRGELRKVTQSSYLAYDLARYRACLKNFRQGWGHYLTELETALIAAKLERVLASLTFAWTRQPQFLVVTPDRVAPLNLRISEKIKVLNEGAAGDDATKFFKPLSDDLLDPDREEEVTRHVGSVLHTLTHGRERLELDRRLRKDGTTLEQVLQKQAKQAEADSKKQYSLHKDCALAGFDAIARRPKHHLIASILWLVDFTYRKTERKAGFFLGDRSGAHAETAARVEQEYDDVLDTLKGGILANYGKDEINAALDVVQLKEGGYETDFEKHVRAKAAEREATQSRL